MFTQDIFGIFMVGLMMVVSYFLICFYGVIENHMYEVFKKKVPLAEEEFKAVMEVEGQLPAEIPPQTYPKVLKTKKTEAPKEDASLRSFPQPDQRNGPGNEKNADDANYNIQVRDGGLKEEGATFYSPQGFRALLRVVGTRYEVEFYDPISKHNNVPVLKLSNFESLWRAAISATSRGFRYYGKAELICHKERKVSELRKLELGGLYAIAGAEKTRAETTPNDFFQLALSQMIVRKEKPPSWGEAALDRIIGHLNPDFHISRE